MQLSAQKIKLKADTATTVLFDVAGGFFLSQQRVRNRKCGRCPHGSGSASFLFLGSSNALPSVFDADFTHREPLILVFSVKADSCGLMKPLCVVWIGDERYRRT